MGVVVSARARDKAAMTNNKATEIALFRFQVIASLVSLDGPRGALKREIARLAAREHVHPKRGPIQIGVGTIEEWLHRYRHHGIDGLEDKARRDRGSSRRIEDEIADAIMELATERPELDGPGLLAELRTKHDEASLPSLSTLYRFLRARNLHTRGAPARKDHRAFEFDHAGDCWHGDVMYGPTIPTKDGKRRKTYLLAVLDDATRLVVHAEFYFDQHLRSLKDCMKQALLKYGVPFRLYLDNGQIFRSRLLLQVCARLGIQLVHTRPYQPQGRAKLERWFRTVRQQFLKRVDDGRCKDLATLNRLFFEWVEGEYNERPHRGIDDEIPRDRWRLRSESIRRIPVDLDLDLLFREETTRRVAKDGTLSLNRRRFEAGPFFIGDKVTVSFDPFDLRSIVVTASSGETVVAHPVDLASNRRVKRLSSADIGRRASDDDTASQAEEATDE
jgi:putative transposase